MNPVAKAERRALRGTPVSRQGYLPDLEPLLRPATDLSHSLLPRSRSSPSCSPRVVGAQPSLGAAGDLHIQHAGVCVRATSPSQPALPASSSKVSGSRTRLWGTVFSMASATLGAGALSLPYAFEQLGALGGVTVLLVTAFASHYSVVLLVAAITRTGARSYEELTVQLFGKPLGVAVEASPQRPNPACAQSASGRETHQRFVSP